MSFVVTGAVIAAATAVAGTAVTIYGQQEQKKAVEAQADYNEEVARLEAGRENELATQNALRVEKQKTRTISALRASNAANGIALEGTPLAVLGDVAADFEQEIADIGYGAANRRSALLSQAALGRYSADQQQRSLTINQVGTGIKGVSSGASGYLNATGT